MLPELDNTKWSGQRIDLAKFKSGWLLIGHQKAHYFTRTNGGFKADCGFRPKGLMRDLAGFVAFEPGNFPLCRKCQDRS